MKNQNFVINLPLVTLPAIIVVIALLLLCSCSGLSNAVQLGAEQGSYIKMGWMKVDPSEDAPKTGYKRLQNEMTYSRAVKNLVVRKDMPNYIRVPADNRLYLMYLGEGVIYELDTHPRGSLLSEHSWRSFKDLPPDIIAQLGQKTDSINPLPIDGEKKIQEQKELKSPEIISTANIKGRIAIVTRSGDIKYGAKIEVLLTTKEISVIPVVAKTEGTIKSIEASYRYDTIVSLGNAWEKVSNEIKNNPSYVKAKTITNLNGEFIFPHVESGKYFVVVTYPSTISMNKVFWQIPVNVIDKALEIELSNDNLTLPAYFGR